MTYRVVQSDHPLPALGRDVTNDGMSDCQPTQVLVFAGMAKTNDSGNTNVDLKALTCKPTTSRLVSFVATAFDKNGGVGKPTPIITWYSLPGPNVPVRSVDANGNPIRDVEFGWQAVVELRPEQRK